MKHTVLDLVVCSTLAVVAMLMALLAPDIGAARAIVGLPLVLFAPGYALVAAAFPAGRLPMAERMLFSLGASLAAVALAGLLLHWTALGLRPAAWAVALGNLTLVGSAIALARRWRLPAGLMDDRRWTVDDSAIVHRLPSIVGTGDGSVLARARRPLSTMTLAQGGLLGLAALLVAGAFLIARDGAIQQRAAGFTQLWVLPDSAASTESVRLGVSNREQGQIGYRLLVTASGTIIGSWPRITLGPNEQWEASVALPTAQPAAATVEAVLYRLDAPETAYRRVLFRRDTQGKQ